MAVTVLGQKMDPLSSFPRKLITSSNFTHTHLKKETA